MGIQSINPATGEVIETFDITPHGEMERILDQAWVAQGKWRRLTFTERAVQMRRAAELLRARAEEVARSMALEMGKPVAQGEAEVAKCAWVSHYYAQHAERFLSPETRETDASQSYVRFDPLGVVLAVMPWNFPFWQVFRFAAPALMAGNGAILKHASNVSRSALDIESIFREAGFPEGLFRTVLVPPAGVPALIADPRISAVTLTGSDAAGSQVGMEAGRAIKKCVLELGGSDPFVVLEDADLNEAARAAADSRLVNSGQSCIAAKRFIVVDAVLDRFLDLFSKEMAARKVGNPQEKETQVGPLARLDLRDSLHAQVLESVKRGAKVVIGGQIPPGKGAYYPPTVLNRVERGMPAFDEETFGPVAAVIRAQDADDAVRLANSSPYGLGAAIFTRDLHRAERLVAQIEAGCVFVNGMVKSDPRLPFGGVKRSGYGRELDAFGIREFVNIKSVWIG